MTVGIYVIKCEATGKVYVGSSKDIEKRWSQHLWLLNTGNHHSPKLQNAWNKYGQENFAFLIIEEVLDSAELLSTEQKHIDDYNSFVEGYNAARFAERNSSSTSFTPEPMKLVHIRMSEYEYEVLRQYVDATKTSQNEAVRELIRTLPVEAADGLSLNQLLTMYRDRTLHYDVRVDDLTYIDLEQTLDHFSATELKLKKLDCDVYELYLDGIVVARGNYEEIMEQISQ